MVITSLSMFHVITHYTTIQGQFNHAHPFHFHHRVAQHSIKYINELLKCTLGILGKWIHEQFSFHFKVTKHQII